MVGPAFPTPNRCLLIAFDHNPLVTNPLKGIALAPLFRKSPRGKLGNREGRGEAATAFSSPFRGVDVGIIRHPVNLQRPELRVDDSKFCDGVVLMGLALDQLFGFAGRLGKDLADEIGVHVFLLGDDRATCR